MKRHLSLPVTVLLVLLSNCYAAVLLDVSMTGQDLLSDPNASFPNGAPILNGTSIEFAPGSTNFDKLINYSLLSAGQVNANDEIVVTIQANLKQLMPDHDKGFVISDGSFIEGALTADNVGGSVYYIRDLDNSPTSIAPNIATEISSTGIPATGTDFDVETVISLGATDTTFTTFMNGQVTFAHVYNLDPSLGLNFYLATGHLEPTWLNTLSLKVENLSVTAVPEPSTYALIALGLIGLGIYRRRRK